MTDPTRSSDELLIGQPRRYVVPLGDPDATEDALTGRKAASLAKASAAGMDILPGVVLTTCFAAWVDHGIPSDTGEVLREVFAAANGDELELVVRSSSVLEDTDGSSMAGQFESVVGTSGFDEFRDAVDVVLGSRDRAGFAGSPIAVLVQPLLRPRVGGVMFGIDPVSGRSDRRVVAVVEGGPDALVSGLVSGSRYVLDPHGKVLSRSPDAGVALAARDLRRLVELGRSVEQIFGSPQDVEWAIAPDGHLWLLQSRAVTTEARGVPSGPIYGPGPIAETFPEPLAELEHDLWVPPLREAVREAVTLAGNVRPKEIDSSDIVVNIGGHVAIDLRIAGDIPAPRTWVDQILPITGLRRLAGAWRVGRLRAALPALVDRLIDTADRDLENVPALSDLTSRQLVALLHRGRSVLRALHAHEILLGMLTGDVRNQLTGASVALRVLAEARRDGLTDAQLLARSPLVLALTPPRVAPAPELPVVEQALPPLLNERLTDDDGIRREALRLRVRWVQELTGRAAWELGVRLTRTGKVIEPDMVRHLPLDQLEAIFTGRAVVVPSLVRTHLHVFGPPLPAWFQLTDRRMAVAVARDDALSGGTGAGGGIGRGRVSLDATDPPAGSVLVTTTLTPGLGPVLPRLAGIVAETGSVLSHLAILAREAGVPTVVGYPNALRDLSEGAEVEVDGQTGHVAIVSSAAPE